MYISRDKNITNGDYISVALQGPRRFETLGGVMSHVQPKAFDYF